MTGNENFKNFNACTVLTRLYQIKAEQDGLQDVCVTVTEVTAEEAERIKQAAASHEKRSA